MLVADAECDGHWNDAAVDRRPEGVEELLVVAEKDDQLVARARAESLQMVQDPECALAQLAEGNGPRIALAFEVGDAARERVVALEQLGQCRAVRHQRRSNLM